MVTWAAYEDGCVSNYNRRHYMTFRDIGMIIVEATAVSPEGRLAPRQIGAFSHRHQRGLQKLADVIHAHNSVAAIQLHHAGGQTTLKNTFGLPLLAPSAIKQREDLPREMTLEDMQRVQDDFVAAAQRAAAAGFDAIELHGAHGYLMSQFFSPATNRRQDAYGGSLENRARFALETFAKVQAAVGDECLVYIRLGVADGIDDGLTIEEGVQLAQWFVAAGAPLLHISSGIGGAPAWTKTDAQTWSGTLQLAARIKQEVDVPVIGVGGIVQPQQAESALNAKMADLIAVGKAHLADPLWTHKILKGKAEAIKACRGCPRCGHYRHPFRCPNRPHGL